MVSEVWGLREKLDISHKKLLEKMNQARNDNKSFFLEFNNLIENFKNGIQKDDQNLIEGIKKIKGRFFEFNGYFYSYEPLIKNETHLFNFVKLTQEYYKELENLFNSIISFDWKKKEFDKICKKIYDYFNLLDIYYWGLIVIIEGRLSYKEEKLDLEINSKQEEVVIVLNQNNRHLVKEIKETIEQNSIVIYGQGIYNISNPLETSDLENAEKCLIEREILCRIKDTNGEYISPKDFLPIIDMLGYKSRLDRCMIERTFIFLKENGDKIVIGINGNPELGEDGKILKYSDIKFGININPKTFEDPNFLDRIILLIQTTGINPHNIVFELLEYEIIKDHNKIDELFGEMRKLGFKIAIDDYPKGFNTLYEITKFKNIDIIKVDGENVIEMFKFCSQCGTISQCGKDLEDNLRKGWKCGRGVANCGNNLETLIQSLNFLKLVYPNIMFITERVENSEYYNFLKNCHLLTGFQGFGLSKPFEMEGPIITKDIINRSEIMNDYQELLSEIETNQEEENEKIILTGKINDLQSEISILEERIDNFLKNLEIFFESLIEIGEIKGKLNIFELIDNNDFNIIKIILKTFEVLGINALTIYKENNKEIMYYRIDKNGGIIKDNVRFDNGNLYIIGQENLPEKFTNICGLVNGLNQEEVFGFKISKIGIPGRGDDAVVKLNDGIFLGIDDESRGKKFQSGQIKGLILLCNFIKNNFQIC